MWCPKCGHEKTKVVHTDKANFVRRYRRCEACDHSFPTYEAVTCDEQWKRDEKYTHPLNQLGLFDDEV